MIPEAERSQKMDVYQHLVKATVGTILLSHNDNIKNQNLFFFKCTFIFTTMNINYYF